jgi:hypothetical protein
MSVVPIGVGIRPSAQAAIFLDEDPFARDGTSEALG